MARYVTLIRFTDKGAAGISKSTARAAAFDKAVQKTGVKVEAQLWTAGSFDGILILSASSEKAALSALAKLAATGFVHTETLRDFWGFNRAKHAVIEAAIFCTRLHFLPLDEVSHEFAKLRVIVDKTGGSPELEAFAFLEDHLHRTREQRR